MAANRARAFLIGKVHNIYANLGMAYPWKTNAESLRLVLHIRAVRVSSQGPRPAMSLLCTALRV